MQRTEAVAAEVTAQVGTKVARQELEDRILWRKVQFNILFRPVFQFAMMDSIIYSDARFKDLSGLVFTVELVHPF